MDDLAKVSHLHFDSLDDVELPIGQSIIYETKIRDVAFELFCSLKKSHHLLVFGQGAVDREKHTLPVFQRWSWAEESELSVIVFNDPTLYLGELTLGWLQGTAEHFYLPDMVQIIKQFVAKLGLKNEDVLFYGSSGGGFTSLMMAGLMHGASAVVNNPQTDILLYHERHVEALLKNSFNSITKEQARDKYKTRLNLIEFFKSVEHVPDFYYIQNTTDLFHFVNHFRPFMSQVYNMMREDERYRSARVYTELYQDPASHAPLSKAETVERIERARRWFLTKN